MLIVLDNARDEQQVRPLLPVGSGNFVIVTSRNQLIGLAAGEGACLVTLDVLSDAEARQVLGACLGSERAAVEQDAIDEIAWLCARLPLALAIAAAHAVANPRLLLTDLAARLYDTHDRLDALDTGDPSMSVRAVFAWSVRQFGPEAARMFRILGLHPGPDVSVSAAASLAGIALPAARRALRELTAANLLAEHLPGRYGFHDLLRVYAAEQAEAIDDAEARRAATGRVLDHYLHTSRTAAVLLHPTREQVDISSPRAGVITEILADHQQALTWFEAEHQVLLSAVRLADETGFDTYAWQLPWAMADFLNRHGRWHELVALERTALTAATRLGDLTGQAATLRHLGHTYNWLGDYAQASAHLAECLELYGQLGDPIGQARVHQTLCHLAERQDRLADGLHHAEQALSHYRACGNRPGQAAALSNVGWFHALLGDYHRARSLCQQALTLCRELGLPNREAAAWDSLGYAEHLLGNLTEAAACYQQSLALFRNIDDRCNEAVILTHLGDNSHAADEPQQARQAWQLALDIFDDLHHPDADKLRQKLRQL
jgi:tetratricopeptide (TPR) repeat protein